MSDTYTINTKKVSSNNQYARISSRPDLTTPYQQTIATTPILLTIDGTLTEGRRLAFPIVVQIEDDEGEIIVSESRFNIYASATTIREAIAAFKRIFSGYLDVLSEDEENLGSYLREQIEYLRSAIRMD